MAKLWIQERPDPPIIHINAGRAVDAELLFPDPQNGNRSPYNESFLGGTRQATAMNIMGAIIVVLCGRERYVDA